MQLINRTRPVGCCAVDGMNYGPRTALGRETRGRAGIATGAGNGSSGRQSCARGGRLIIGLAG